jgi:hypothetical protein
MVEISLSGSEGAPGGQLPGATREAGVGVASWIVVSNTQKGNKRIDGPSPTANTSSAAPTHMRHLTQRGSATGHTRSTAR